ncbi:MAG: type VI secretion protein [Ruminococcus sp.]|nr:type VI secretion protein [Ruminococcus sp.]
MNYETKKLKQEIENGNFFINNGRILQMLNVLSGGFKKLTELKFVLSDVEEYEIVRSIDYLYESGYIKLRNVETGKPTCLADTSFKYLSAKLTADGTRILVGKKTDDCIKL